MTEKVQKEVQRLIKKLNLDCTVEEFQNKVDWDDISAHQNLSEDFIRAFQDKVYWDNISRSQKLSDNFIREFKKRVDWVCISIYQKPSESFIRKFQDKVSWIYLSPNVNIFQNLLSKNSKNSKIK